MTGRGTKSRQTVKGPGKETTRIAILMEGATEKVFFPKVREFLEKRLGGNMPKLSHYPFDGRLPKDQKLCRWVENLLKDGHKAVIALADVYPDFADVHDAKKKMRQWAGGDVQHFHPHVALHDFEAWLLPYWSDIQRLAGSNRTSPAPNPETVNHGKPPSRVLEEIFRTGTKKRAYSKVRDASAILRDKDLAIAAEACSELRAFLNTILKCAGGEQLEDSYPAGDDR